MQHTYPQSLILWASTVSQALILVHKEIIGALDAQSAGKAGTTHIRVDIPRIPTLGIGGFLLSVDLSVFFKTLHLTTSLWYVCIICGTAL